MATEPNMKTNEYPQQGALGYAWIPLPKPINRKGELFPYALLPRTEDEAQKLLEHFMANRPNAQ